MTRGMIITYIRPLPFGGRHTSYRWEGGDVIAISAKLVDDLFLADYPKAGDLFRLGPFWLRVLDYRFDRNDVLAIRERPVKARAYYAFYRATRVLDRVYRLAIVTLYVWGVARYDRGRVPSWRDVKGAQRLAAWVDARQAAKRRAMIERINTRLKEEA